MTITVQVYMYGEYLRGGDYHHGVDKPHYPVPMIPYQIDRSDCGVYLSIDNPNNGTCLIYWAGPDFN